MIQNAVCREILTYLEQQYAPLALIVYGSYADGTSRAHSDFDALVITGEHPYLHDTSTVAGVTLDVFVYPKFCFEGAPDCDAFLQIAEGTILLDTDGIAQRLQQKVMQYIDTWTYKTAQEIHSELAWCEKMLSRAERGDTEGFYRHHWVLTDSIEIFCDVVHRRFTGPRKTLHWMEREYPEAYALYSHALAHFDTGTLQEWVAYLSRKAATLS